ncbi:MAG TPA: SIMPL domain-containing protein, partial [Glaciihabitans sp.]|nr:SIMPL domain-containing protein [Glaciihabitans sp.]
MNETIISVRGEFSAHYPAERATVHADVSSDGPDRQTVFDAATAAVASVAALTTPMHNATDGPITEWSSDTVSVWSDRPWNAEGAQLPLVYHARIGVTAQFSDFSALARWIEGALAIDGVGVTAVDWTLTAGRTTTVTAEVCSR